MQIFNFKRETSEGNSINSAYLVVCFVGIERQKRFKIFSTDLYNTIYVCTINIHYSSLFPQIRSRDACRR